MSVSLLSVLSCLCFVVLTVQQEIHVMHEYTADFYGMELRAVVLGYIRPELDFTTMGALYLHTSFFIDRSLLIRGTDRNYRD